MVGFVVSMSADVTCVVVVGKGLCLDVCGGRGLSCDLSLVAPGPPPRKEVGDLQVNLHKTQMLTMKTSEAETEGHVPFSGKHPHAVASGRSMPWLPISTGSCVVQPNLQRHDDMK